MSNDEELYCTPPELTEAASAVTLNLLPPKSRNRYFEFKTPLLWRNVILVSVFHLLAIYGFMLIPYGKWTNAAWSMLCVTAADTAVSAGAHRLWTHKTYKAKLPMRIIAMLCYMLAGQYSIVQWARDHRTHHKYTDTDADPHSAARGFFYSHVGWLMMKRHPEVKEKGKVIDVSDLWEDPVIQFHQKHFATLLVLVHVLFPSCFAYYVLGETLKNSIFVTLIARYALSLNLLWCTNSVAHYWGDKPYNKNIKASQNAFLAFMLVGEGWHNFHHTFPWDYRVGELNQGYQFSAYVIEFFARFGLAYDLKTASPDLIDRVVAKQHDLPVNFEAPEDADKTGAEQTLCEDTNQLKGVDNLTARKIRTVKAA